MRAQKSKLPRKALRMRNVVRILAGNELTLCEAQAAIEARGEAKIRLVAHDTDPWVAESGEQFRGAIRGGVIDDDEFKIPETLPQNALDRLANERRTVADGKKDGDLRFSHGSVVILSTSFSSLSSLSPFVPFVL